MSDNGQTVDTKSSSVAELTLKETLCLNFTSGSRSGSNPSSSTTQLHTIEFVRMEQQFPIVAKYKFAIPQIISSCICDCAGAEQNCTKGSICYRTYHAHQSNAGCLTQSLKSEVCCDVAIEPYNNKMYTAIKLNQPDTIVVLKHKIYERIANRWIEASSDEFDAIINKGSAIIESIDRRKIEIRVTSGRVIREMNAGMYYYSDEIEMLMTGIRLNEPSESDIHKLGWMRNENGKWIIRNGIIKITDSQHITVESCKGQKYLTRYNLEYFVSGNEGLSELDLGFPVDDESWVEDISIANDRRSVRVVHAEGTAIHLTINTDIRLGGKGTLIGYVYRSDDKLSTEWSFSVEMGSKVRSSFMTIIGGLSSTINSDRFVCLHPVGNTYGEICNWLRLAIYFRVYSFSKYYRFKIIFS
ncbi:unnamed protein product [Anisakis simplex]|uniref:Phlebovirus_G2 domain-containing protein n=1 Tax=Anisakis simplex TaxID=6269 RepID=A0A0M3KA87_ANISI|nr:unnamed protein product [Anisakis simplex]